MNEKRLKTLLFNALVKFADDEYQKENVIYDLGMRAEELAELEKEFDTNIFYKI